MRRLLLPCLAALLLAPAALAGSCRPELAAAAAALPAELPAGVAAAELLRAAVELVEPALPKLQYPDVVPLAEDAPGFEAVRYLDERRLLPDGWRADTLDAAVWSEMLDRFLGWYALTPQATASPTSREVLVDELAGALERIAQAVRPVALVAWDPVDPDRIAFWGLMWNWTVYPRLIVRRPPQGLSLADGVEAVLPRLGSCAVQPHHFVLAAGDTARRLFLANSEARMYVVGSEPQSDAWPLLVDRGDEPAFFDYGDPEVSGLDAYAAVFDGPTVGLPTLLRLMPRLRTNLPPTRLLAYLATP